MLDYFINSNNSCYFCVLKQKQSGDIVPVFFGVTTMKLGPFSLKGYNSRTICPPPKLTTNGYLDNLGQTHDSQHDSEYSSFKIKLEAHRVNLPCGCICEKFI